jgi:hypothetical protein
VNVTLLMSATTQFTLRFVSGFIPSVSAIFFNDKLKREHEMA